MAGSARKNPESDCLSEEMAAAFVDGVLDDSELAELDRHIASCQDCDHFVTALAQLAESPELSPSNVELRGRVGRYEIIEPIGRGAMGVVYRARDPELDRDVAIKLLRSGADTNRGARRLLVEARAMARLRHANVIAVHDIGSFQGEVFIAMDLVEGSTLREWLRGDRSEEEIVSAFVSAGQGLAAAHRVGIVHRDFKPDNVLVADAGDVVVTDFGLARGLTVDTNSSTSSTDGEAALDLTETGAILGTPLYMSPEQFEGIADARSDQFSFAVAMWEACAGQRPFVADDVESLAAAINASEPNGKPKPGWVVPILRRALARDPGDRFDSMEALLATLERGGSHPRRWPQLVAITAVLAVGSTSLAVLAQDKSATACAAIAAESASVWNPKRREQLVAAVSGVEEPFGGDAARAIVNRIDERTSRWLALRAQSCRDAAAAVQPREISARAHSCLSSALSDLDVTIAAITEAGASAALRGVEHIDRLDDLEVCLGPEAVAPETEEAREISRTISQARALHDTGRYRLGLETLGDAADRAAAQEDHRLVSRARHLECALRHRLGDTDAAEKACHASAVAAATGGHADRAAEAWTLLVGLVARDKARFEDADRWADYARAATERAGNPLRLVAALENTLGVVAKQRGKYDDALAHYLSAVDFHRRAYGDDDLRLARTLNNLAILEGVLGRSESAAAHHREALTIKEAKLGHRHPSVAASLTNLGLIYRGDNDDLARPLFERALDIARDSLPNNHPTTTAIRSNLGLLEWRAGNLEVASGLLGEALASARARAAGKPHPSVASLLDNLGLVTRSLGDSSAAVELHRDALAMRRAVFGDDHDHVGRTANNLAIALGDVGKHDEALVYFEQALAIHEKTLGDDHLELVADLVGVGQSHLALGNSRAALAPLERAMTLVAKHDVEPELAAAARMNLARTLRAIGGDSRRAAGLARAALEHYESVGEAADAKAARAMLAYFDKVANR